MLNNVFYAPMIKYTFKPHEAHRILSLRFGRESGAKRPRIKRVFDYGVRLGEHGNLIAFSFREIDGRPQMRGEEGAFYKGLGWSYPAFMGLEDGETPSELISAGLSEITILKNNGAPHRVGDKGFEDGLKIEGTYAQGWNLISGKSMVNPRFTEARAVFATQVEITHGL